MAIWLLHERYSRPRSETFIWYFWVIWSYIHLYGLEISIKASRRYHGNHQEKNMSNDEAPCEAFNRMHILELPIVGHIKPNKEFFVRYISKIYNTNDSVPIAGLNDSHSILLLSHTWVRYPGFSGHGVKCPILTTVVPGFPAIWLVVPFGANGAHLGICALPEKNLFVCEISCFWVK